LKVDYAFNFWVLNKIYNVDEEVIPALITDRNDKSIDCYVYYEEIKTLHIIQNKYYKDSTYPTRDEINDFLNAPLDHLLNGNYRNETLQRLFTKIKTDPTLKIYLNFYISNDKHTSDTKIAFQTFNTTAKYKIGELVIPEMSKAFYMLTPVWQIWEMMTKAKEAKYKLFEENIREYLGDNDINGGIMNTLNNAKERSNFFYYNNGITIICEGIDKATNILKVTKPQIVNGCQTVNSIYETLEDYGEASVVMAEFKDVFVMVKILLFDDKTRLQKTDKFYTNIVKYNNKQNPINEKAFASKKPFFSKIQDGLRNRGFLLLVKPSDKNKSSEINTAEINTLMALANKYGEKVGVNFTKKSDLFIDLEKLLQVYLAFVKDGYYAYTKKSSLLKENSEWYLKYSLNINDLNFDNLIRLWVIYVKAERERQKSQDLTTPIPNYIIGFFGYLITNKEKNNSILENLFTKNNDSFEDLYDYLKTITSRYKKAFLKLNNNEYNSMIKTSIDLGILEDEIKTTNDFKLDNNPTLGNLINSFNS